jgi:phage repressor protein C with HTH and peptisase S24 domain
MKIGNKLRIVRESVNMTQTELAESVEVSLRSIQNYEKDGGNISLDTLEKLTIPLGVPITYFFSEDIEPKAQAIQKSTITAHMYEDVYAAAGYGGNGDSAEAPVPVQIDEKLLRDVFNVFSTKSIDIINVTGDSMEPFIKNGEKVIVERVHEAYDNNLVIAMVDEHLYVKRFLRDPLGRWAKLTSMNEFYPDILLEGDDIKRLKIIGIVRGQWRPR